MLRCTCSRQALPICLPISRCEPETCTRGGGALWITVFNVGILSTAIVLASQSFTTIPEFPETLELT
jgi:hypothetical protein